MPVVFQYTTGCGRLALWRITESEQELRALVTASDAASCAEMRDAGRRLQRLAWRALLRTMEPATGEVYYKEGTEGRVLSRTPVVKGLAGHIGVSHCEGYAALICSSAPCAIDIEPFARDFSRAAPRFIAPEEATLGAGFFGSERAMRPHCGLAVQGRQPVATPGGGLPSSPAARHISPVAADCSAEATFEAIAWCVKETVYKLAGIPGLDLRGDIRITGFEPVADTADGPQLATLTATVRGEAIPPLRVLSNAGLCIVYTEKC